jgi:hypothetical protein
MSFRLRCYCESVSAFACSWACEWLLLIILTLVERAQALMLALSLSISLLGPASTTLSDTSTEQNNTEGHRDISPQHW